MADRTSVLHVFYFLEKKRGTCKKFFQKMCRINKGTERRTFHSPHAPQKLKFRNTMAATMQARSGHSGAVKGVWS